MNSTRALSPFFGTEPIGTAKLHDFNERLYWGAENVLSATSGVSYIALGLNICGNSDRISPSMGSQRHTRFIIPKGPDLDRIMEIRHLVQHVEKNLPETSRYCPEQTHLQSEDFTYRNDAPVNSIDLESKGIG